MADFRREYGSLVLNVAGAEQSPFALFENWLSEIIETDNYDPTAMVLSTIDEDGLPDSRVVLLKGIEQGRFLFYTNYGSSKAQQIEANSKVALNFFWPFMARQVRISGVAAKLDDKANDLYFESRPRLSQIAAIASDQSQPIASRQVLEDKMNELIDTFGQDPIIRPKDWGGYAVEPFKVEFWQGRDNRLHDRLLYTKHDSEEWLISRLAP